MPDEANAPVTVPPLQHPGPTAGRRTAWLLGLGVGVGLAVGVLLTLGAVATYTTVLTPTVIPASRDSLRVFTELNELRQQVNRLNEERKVQDQDKEEAIRRALKAVATTVRPPDIGPPAVAPPAEKKGGDMAGRPARRAGDPFADLDAEIERLEETQKVLNTILDLFTPKGQEPAKDRKADFDPPR